jgi:SAM-dependent methyltransferase
VVDRFTPLVHWMVPGIEFHQNRYARELDLAVRPGSRWLDLGAGTRLHSGWLGLSQEELASRSALLVGCDLVGDHLRRNALLGAGVVSDGCHLPFDDCSFDVVSANMVLEHLPDPGAVFAEVARVLAPGGRFVFVTPNLGHPAVRLLSLLLAPRARRWLAHLAEERELEHIFLTHYRANSPGAVASAGRAAGLRASRLETFCSYPMLRFFLPLTAVELLWIRLCMLRPLRGMGSNLVGCLERDEVPLIVGRSRIRAEVTVAA